MAKHSKQQYETIEISTSSLSSSGITKQTIPGLSYVREREILWPGPNN